MGSFHCAQAWLGGDALLDDVLIEEESGTIVAVEAGVAAPAGATSFRGAVVPGFANAHSHAFHRALRGRVDGAGSFWTWRDAMYDLAARLDPGTLHDLALGAFAEMAMAGFTAVGEFHYLHFDPSGAPYDDVHATARSIAAAAHAAGLRLTVLDCCYLEGAPGQPVSGVQRRFADGSAAAWAERAGALAGALDDDVVVGAAIHSIRAVPPAAAGLVAEWATTRDVPLHAHVSEQPAENDAALAAYGATPTQLLEQAGALSRGFTAVHGTHLSPEDRATLGAHGASVCVCPTTERDLGDGLCEVGPMRELGVAICLGTDSQAVVDPFEELRCLEGHERLRTLRRGTMRPDELLEAAIAAGHRAIGRPRAGSLRTGAPCDLVHVASDAARRAGSTSLAGLVASGTAADVRDVVVGGRAIVQDGVHAGVDAAALLEATISRIWS